MLIGFRLFIDDTYLRIKNVYIKNIESQTHETCKNINLPGDN